MKKNKIRIEPCRWCGNLTNEFYVIADDLENPKPYHKDCINQMFIKALTDQEKWTENKLAKKLK